MTPFEQVEQAYLHFCWAVKLDSYLRAHPPESKADFDNAQIVSDPADRCRLPGDQFQTMADIHLGAENAILVAVGALFLALDTALEEAGIENDPDAKDSDNFGQLRMLVHMSRCAFAHNVLSPHWEARGSYKRKLSIDLPGISLELDLATLDSQPWHIDHIGGCRQLLKIKDCILARLASSQ